jgi:hypothetical protein
MTAPNYKDLLADMAALLARLEHRTAGGATPPTGHTCGSLELDARDSPAADPTDPRGGYHNGHFGPEHGLNPEQAWLAEQILKQKPPFRGPHAQQREARRIAGIVSAVRNGRVSSAHWGHSMLAKRGGLAVAAHAPQVLARNREGILARRRALRAWQQRHPEPQTEFEAWQRSITVTPWEMGSQQNFMAY